MKHRITGIGIFMIVSMIVISGCSLKRETETLHKTKTTESQETVLQESETDTSSLFSEDISETSDEDRIYFDAEAGYMSFLGGETTAIVISEEDMILEEGEYTLEDLCDRCAAFFREIDMPDILKSMEYALIDCGLDGEPELAVCMEFTTSDEYDFAKEYLFFKLMDGRIQYITGCNSYYRNEVWLNRAGMICTSTMFDYYNMKQKEMMIDANGRNSFVYSTQYVTGLEANLIPTNYLPTDVREELDIHFSNLGDSQRMYMLTIYNFLEPPVSDDENDYDEYLRGNRYVFSDEAGNPATPEDEILNLYQENGILIYEENEMNALLEEYKKELGITWEIENAPEIEWTALETPTDRETIKVKAEWAVDVQGDLSDCEKYIPNDEEEQVLIVFSSDSKVKDFKILALSSGEFNDDGKAIFSTVELYNYGTLEPEHPLVAGMTFIGSIPNNGISYVDENGITRFFAVEVSGYDGSLLLSEIQCK